jgi:hypothetical protein
MLVEYPLSDVTWFIGEVYKAHLTINLPPRRSKPFHQLHFHRPNKSNFTADALHHPPETKTSSLASAFFSTKLSKYFTDRRITMWCWFDAIPFHRFWSFSIGCETNFGMKMRFKASEVHKTTNKQLGLVHLRLEYLPEGCWSFGDSQKISRYFSEEVHW